MTKYDKISHNVWLNEYASAYASIEWFSWDKSCFILMEVYHKIANNAQANAIGFTSK